MVCHLSSFLSLGIRSWDTNLVQIQSGSRTETYVSDTQQGSPEVPGEAFSSVVVNLSRKKQALGWKALPGAWKRLPFIAKGFSCVHSYHFSEQYLLRKSANSELSLCGFLFSGVLEDFKFQGKFKNVILISLYSELKRL